MNPIDYFDPSYRVPSIGDRQLSRDTLKRALGKPVLPQLSAWKKLTGKLLRSEDPTLARRLEYGKTGYETRYGSRIYTLYPITTGGVSAGYAIVVIPGVEYVQAFVTFGGQEAETCRTLLTQYDSAQRAVVSANKHAIRTGLV